MTAPRIVGVAPGDPFDRLTWSGTAYRLFDALRQTGSLAGAVSGRSVVIDRAMQASSFVPDRRRWARRYGADISPLAPALRAARTRTAARRIARTAAEADSLLQIGAWLNGGAISGLRVRSSYHDGNLAIYVRQPGSLLDRDSRAVRSALAREKQVYDGMDVVFAMSEYLRTSFVEDFGQDPQKVVAVGAGPNFDRIPEPVDRTGRAPRLLFVGKGQFDRKGGHVLLDAFSAVRTRRPDAELWLVGPPPVPSPPPGVNYRGRISRATPEGRAELERCFSQATIFVLPALWELFGVAVLEGMAYGLPCVVTETCAMPEMVIDGETGRVVPPGDSDALADALLQLIDAPERAAAMGAAGRSRLVERYTWPRVAARMVDTLARSGASA